MKCEKIQLKNGLKILLAESKKSPVVSVQMWVRTGSADELEGEEGISHFIEHLVFKGSRSFGVGEIAATIEASGGQINAYTSFDQTVFYVTLSNQFEDVGLKIISEMMGSPLFDAEEIDKEREVVVEEIRRGEDSVHRQASRLLFSTLYKGHPYEKPVIGYEKNVRAFTTDQIKSYFSGRYNPHNMFLLVVGDFDSQEMLEKIKVNYESFDESPLRESNRGNWSPSRESEIVVREGKFKETLAYLTWPLPAANHKDMPALEVLAMILGQGESSRMHRYLRLKKASVLGAGAGIFSAKESGFLALTASLKGSQQEEFYADLAECLEDFMNFPPTQQELDKAKTNFFSEQFYSMETVDGLARKYGHFEDLFENPDYLEEMLEIIKNLSVADLVAVFRKYLKPSLAKVIVMTEEGFSKEIKQSAENFLNKYEKSFAKEREFREPVKEGKFQGFKLSLGNHSYKDKRLFEVEKLKNGATLIYRPSFETPVVSLRAAHLGGARFEGPGQFGATELLSRIWTSGSSKFSEEEINHRMESYASSMSAFGGRHTIGLSLTTLSSFLDQTYEVLSDVLTAPSLPEEAYKRELDSMKDQLSMRPDHPAQYCMLQFMQTLFGDHPYGRDPFGGVEDLNILSKKSVQEIWKDSMGSQDLVVSCSGAVEKKVIVDLLNETLGAWNKPTRSFHRVEFGGLQEDKEVFKEFGKEQTHIVLGYPGLDLKDSDRYVLNIIQAILAGQGGRLFIELRDKASLAYSVSPIRMEALEGGYFGAYIGCTPAKKDKAIEMMRNEFGRITSERVGDKELDRAKRYLIGRHDIDLQKNTSISSSLLFDQIYGTDPKETFEFADHIAKVSSDDILRLSEKIFSRNSVLSVVS